MRKTTSGFTIVEVLIVVAIIGILTAVGFVSYESIQSGSRDSQRSSRITILSEALEKYYDKNGEYPGCTAMAQVPDTVTTNTLKGMDPGVLATPTATSGTNSILSSCTDLTIGGTDGYAYVGDSSSSCLTGQTCPQYTLKYKEESTNNIISINSRHTVTGTATSPSAPAIAVTLNGSNVLATITPVTCSTGTAQYGIHSHTNDGVWGAYTTWSTDTTATQAATEGVKYGYQAQARCYISNYSYSTNSTGAENTYVNPITSTPATPTVAASTANYSTTTYSWDTASCPSSATPRYQYDYSTSYGYDSGWVTMYGTSVDRTTSSFGYTYTVQVKTQCFNAYATGNWSGVGSIGYYRPAPTVQALVVAGGGAGGSSTSDESGGGGGGGGVVWHTAKTVDHQSYSIVVGGGGASNSASGQNSSFQDIIAYGGGGGGPTNSGGYNGGSGGGGAGAMSGSENSRGLSTQVSTGGATPYGNYGGLGQWRANGKSGGGGGGAGGIGGSGYDGATEGPGKMNGGAGLYNTVTGGGVYYAGGGGGASCCYWGSGGTGGGGNGAQNGHGAAGTTNTGGGGGGGGSPGGGTGGSGLVIIRYTTNALGATGGTVTTSGSDTIRTFYSNDTFQVY